MHEDRQNFTISQLPGVAPSELGRASAEALVRDCRAFQIVLAALGYDVSLDFISGPTVVYGTPELRAVFTLTGGGTKVVSPAMCSLWMVEYQRYAKAVEQGARVWAKPHPKVENPFLSRTSFPDWGAREVLDDVLTETGAVGGFGLVRWHKLVLEKGYADGVVMEDEERFQERS